MKDFIYRSDTGTVDSLNRPILLLINAAKAESRGVELGLSGNIGHVHWFGNYTYTKAKIIDNPAVPTSEGKFLTFIPEHAANVGADWTRGRYTVSGAVRYADDRFATDDNTDTVHDVYGAYSAYTLVEAKLGYQITDHLKAALSLDNITDEEWFDNNPGPGRSWFFEISSDLL
jgi:iron complex outermembrane receptor protein